MPGAGRMRFAGVVCGLVLLVALPVSAVPNQGAVEAWGWWPSAVERVSAWVGALLPARQSAWEKEGGGFGPDGQPTAVLFGCGAGTSCTDEGGGFGPDG